MEMLSLNPVGLIFNFRGAKIIIQILIRKWNKTKRKTTFSERKTEL